MIGTEISHYTVVEKIGEGGMGEVYRATDRKLGREVALKVLPESLALDVGRMARFEREARVLASLSHAHIATIHGLEEADGRHALVMELVGGETLAERLERGPLPLEEALEVGRQIAGALEYAHEQGVVHRDLKPANVKLDPSSGVKVLDFGLAKALEPEGEGSASVEVSHSPTLTAQMTQAGMLMGTAAYMSPEQARGQPADRRADVWAFGVVMIEMLSGRSLYGAETVSDTLAGILAREPAWDDLPDSTPRRVRRLLERCLEKDVSRRLQAIGEARIALEDCLARPEDDDDEVAAGRPVGRRGSVLPWALAALLAVALVVAGAGWWSAGRTEPDRPIRVSVEVPAEKDFLGGYGTSVAVSPDGQRFAFAIGDPSGCRLEIRSLDQLEAREVSGENLAYHPFFSPDGQWLGYVTPTELKKVSVTGGASITLADVDRSRGAAWGPDGTIVVAPDGSGPLFRVQAAGGRLEPLTELDEARGEVTHRWPQFVPGGGAIVFTAHTSRRNFDDASIELLDLETMERRTLHSGGHYGRVTASGHLLWIREGTLFGVPFDLEERAIVGSPAPLLEKITASASSSGGAQIDVSDSGLLVYRSGVSEAPSYPVLLVDPRRETVSLRDEEAAYTFPRFSPDGEHLAFVDDQTRDVWVYDTVRQVATRLTFVEGLDQSPVWSPDGRRVAFSSDRDGEMNLYAKAADGSGEVERLTESASPQWPTSWSRDGRSLLYMDIRPKTRSDLMVLDLESGESEVLLATPAVEDWPMISPDGRWIAYGSNESGTQQIYLRPFREGVGKWQVSDAGGRTPRWSPEGDRLYYRLEGQVWSVSIETEGGSLRTGRPELHLQGPFLDLSPSSDFDLHPDGERFVVFGGGNVAIEGNPHFILVLNWFGELERTVGPGR